MRVLIAGSEDRSLISTLVAAGMATDWTDDPEEILVFARHYDIDLILFVEPMGLSEVRTSRRGCKTPMVVLGHDPGQTVPCLRAGADDWQPLDIDPAELVARLQAIERRHRGQASPVVEAGPLVVNTADGRAWVDGKPVHFTPKEFQIVAYLVTRQGAMVPHTKIYDHLYAGMDDPPAEHITRVLVCKIKEKLGWARGLVTTHWGRGYRLDTTDFAPGAAPLRREPGAQTAEQMVLKALAKGGRRTLAQLTRELSIPSSSIGSALARLGRGGLLTTEPSKAPPGYRGGRVPFIYALSRRGYVHANRLVAA